MKKSGLWPVMLLAVALVFVSNYNVGSVSGNLDLYKSPPPPFVYSSPPPPVKSPSPPQLIVEAVGKVYCYRCYDWTNPNKSTGKKHLKGATVEISCQWDAKVIVAYGKTKTDGSYAVGIQGFNYAKYGVEACKAKLHMAPRSSACNIATDLNGGNKGVQVHVKSKNLLSLELVANPFAYAHENCSADASKYSNYLTDSLLYPENTIVYEVTNTTTVVTTNKTTVIVDATAPASGAHLSWYTWQDLKIGAT